MTKVKVPSKLKSSGRKPRATLSPPFKPDIRLANAVIGAIAFLQKASLQATPKIIKKCMLERCRRKEALENIEQVKGYLNRGVELGILIKSNGGFRIGELQLVKRRQRKNKKKQEKNTDDETSVDSIKAPNETLQDMEPEVNA